MGSASLQLLVITPVGVVGNRRDAVIQWANAGTNARRRPRVSPGIGGVGVQPLPSFSMLA